MKKFFFFAFGAMLSSGLSAGDLPGPTPTGGPRVMTVCNQTFCIVYYCDRNGCTEMDRYPVQRVISPD